MYTKDENGETDVKLRKFECPKGESALDVNIRARNFIWDDVVHQYMIGQEEKNKDGKTYNLLVVTHGIFLAEMVHAVK